MQKIQKTVNIAVLAAETSHIFCCVLPTVVSVMSLLAGVGLIGSMPVSLLWLHDVLHDWEVPIIIGSGVVLALAWALHFYAKRFDCADAGCCSEPCAPKKNSASRLLIVASVLFVVNVSVYMFVHRNWDATHGGAESVHGAGHDAHAGHGHHDHYGHDH
ncbi:MAG: hypothetical protein ACRBCT_09060 [Alphaproteobacteria bacterium]